MLLNLTIATSLLKKNRAAFMVRLQGNQKNYFMYGLWEKISICSNDDNLFEKIKNLTCI